MAGWWHEKRRADNGKRKTDPKKIGRQEVTREAGKRQSGSNKVQAAVVMSGGATMKEPRKRGALVMDKANKPKKLRQHLRICSGKSDKTRKTCAKSVRLRWHQVKRANAEKR